MTTFEKVPLGNVVNLARSTVKPQDIDDGRKYVLLEHIVPKTGEVAPILAGASEIRSAKASFQAGDVLYGKLRPKLRKVCVAAWDGYCSTDIIPLRPLYPNSSYYLAAILRSERFYVEVERLVGGANLPRVNPQELLKLEIPWEPDEERVRLNELAGLAVQMRQEVSAFGRSIEYFERALWSQ